MPVITPNIPEGLIELMKNLAKCVLKEKPENIYDFSAVHFEKLLEERDGSLNKGYEKFVASEKYLEAREECLLSQITNRLNKKKKPDPVNITPSDGIEDSTFSETLSPQSLQQKFRPRKLSSRKASEILLSIKEEDEGHNLAEELALQHERVTAARRIQRAYKSYKNKKENNAALIIQRTLKKLFNIKLKTEKAIQNDNEIIGSNIQNDSGVESDVPKDETEGESETPKDSNVGDNKYLENGLQINPTITQQVPSFTEVESRPSNMQLSKVEKSAVENLDEANTVVQKHEAVESEISVHTDNNIESSPSKQVDVAESHLMDQNGHSENPRIDEEHIAEKDINKPEILQDNEELDKIHMTESGKSILEKQSRFISNNNNNIGSAELVSDVYHNKCDELDKKVNEFPTEILEKVVSNESKNDLSKETLELVKTPRENENDKQNSDENGSNGNDANVENRQESNLNGRTNDKTYEENKESKSTNAENEDLLNEIEKDKIQRSLTISESGSQDNMEEKEKEVVSVVENEDKAHDDIPKNQDEDTGLSIGHIKEESAVSEMNEDVEETDYSNYDNEMNNDNERTKDISSNFSPEEDKNTVIPKSVWYVGSEPIIATATEQETNQSNHIQITNNISNEVLGLAEEESENNGYQENDDTDEQSEKTKIGIVKPHLNFEQNAFNDNNSDEKENGNKYAEIKESIDVQQLTGKIVENSAKEKENYFGIKNDSTNENLGKIQNVESNSGAEEKGHDVVNIAFEDVQNPNETIIRDVEVDENNKDDNIEERIQAVIEENSNNTEEKESDITKQESNVADEDMVKTSSKIISEKKLKAESENDEDNNLVEKIADNSVSKRENNVADEDIIKTLSKGISEKKFKEESEGDKDNNIVEEIEGSRVENEAEKSHTEVGSNDIDKISNKNIIQSNHTEASKENKDDNVSESNPSSGIEYLKNAEEKQNIAADEDEAKIMGELTENQHTERDQENNNKNKAHINKSCLENVENMGTEEGTINVINQESNGETDKINKIRNRTEAEIERDENEKTADKNSTDNNKIEENNSIDVDELSKNERTDIERALRVNETMGNNDNEKLLHNSEDNTTSSEIMSEILEEKSSTENKNKHLDESADVLNPGDNLENGVDSKSKALIPNENKSGDETQNMTEVVEEEIKKVVTTLRFASPDRTSINSSNELNLAKDDNESETSIPKLIAEELLQHAENIDNQIIQDENSEGKNDAGEITYQNLQTTKLQISSESLENENRFNDANIQPNSTKVDTATTKENEEEIKKLVKNSNQEENSIEATIEAEIEDLNTDKSSEDNIPELSNSAEMKSHENACNKFLETENEILERNMENKTLGSDDILKIKKSEISNIVGSNIKGSKEQNEEEENYFEGFIVEPDSKDNDVSDTRPEKYIGQSDSKENKEQVSNNESELKSYETKNEDTQKPQQEIEILDEDKENTQNKNKNDFLLSQEQEVDQHKGLNNLTCNNLEKDDNTLATASAETIEISQHEESIEEMQITPEKGNEIHLKDNMRKNSDVHNENKNEMNNTSKGTSNNIENNDENALYQQTDENKESPSLEDNKMFDIDNSKTELNKSELTIPTVEKESRIEDDKSIKSSNENEVNNSEQNVDNNKEVIKISPEENTKLIDQIEKDNDNPEDFKDIGDDGGLIKSDEVKESEEKKVLETNQIEDKKEDINSLERRTDESNKIQNEMESGIIQVKLQEQNSNNENEDQKSNKSNKQEDVYKTETLLKDGYAELKSDQTQNNVEDVKEKNIQKEATNANDKESNAGKLSEKFTISDTQVERELTFKEGEEEESQSGHDANKSTKTNELDNVHNDNNVELNRTYIISNDPEETIEKPARPVMSNQSFFESNIRPIVESEGKEININVGDEQKREIEPEVNEEQVKKHIVSQTNTPEVNSAHLSDVETTRAGSRSTISDEFSEIENIDISNYGEDSLEAMYYSLRKNEIMLDRMQKRASERKSASKERDTPEKLDFRQVKSMGEMNRSISINSDEDVVIRTMEKKTSNEDSAFSNHQFINPISVVTQNTEKLLEAMHQFNSNPPEPSLSNEDYNVERPPCRIYSPSIRMKSRIPTPIKDFPKSVSFETPIALMQRKSQKFMQQLHNDYQSSKTLDDLLDQTETSDTIRQKMLAYSVSEADSDYCESAEKKTNVIHDDSNVSTALETASTDTDSTIVSAATKIQAGARGFLTRRRLRRASEGALPQESERKASFGNEAIGESLEDLVEQNAASKIQKSYRNYLGRKQHKSESSKPSPETSSSSKSSDGSKPVGIIQVKIGQKRGRDDGNVDERKADEIDDGYHGAYFEGLNLAERRMTLQRGDAVQKYSTPEEESGFSLANNDRQGSEAADPRTTTSPKKRKHVMNDTWRHFGLRQRTMPVQIETDILRVLPKHMRKRIKSAEAHK